MNRTGLGLAVGAGYLLGRTKKLKLAFAVGTLVAGKRMHLSPRAVADLVSQQLLKNPQFKEIGDTLRQDLRGVGKAASGAMVERQIDAIADRLHGRTAQVRDQLSGMAPEVPGLSDDEPEEDEESEEEQTGTTEAEADEEPSDEYEDDEDDDAEDEQDDAPAKRTAKKAPAKKTAAKKQPGRKPPAKKAAQSQGRTAGKKTAAKKTTAKKTAAKKTTAARGAGRSTRARLPKGGGE
ncbi:DNA primase [Streptomyces pseudovenezuelae]|uniref:DNA primase n=1 Tax=Streptomyces pseudovenezuelae TaxID=67350 RepID=UPI002E81AD8C|nr:DNA primase [Streptomyces pseudovenezuelae]WUA87304.1 DNA primase [Streptomyces pseudovenezuelae]